MNFTHSCKIAFKRHRRVFFFTFRASSFHRFTTPCFSLARDDVGNKEIIILKRKYANRWFNGAFFRNDAYVNVHSFTQIEY